MSKIFVAFIIISSVLIIGLPYSVSAQLECGPGAEPIWVGPEPDDFECGFSVDSEAPDCPVGTTPVWDESEREWECVTLNCPPGLEFNDSGQCAIVNPDSSIFPDFSDFGELLTRIVQILLTFAGGIVVIFLIVGGFQYVAARGNEEATERAKKTITGAIIGLVIIIMSFAIVSIINNLLTQSPEEIDTTENTGTPGTPGGGDNNGDGIPDDVNESVIITFPNPDTTMIFAPEQINSYIFEATNCSESSCTWQFDLFDFPGTEEEFFADDPNPNDRQLIVNPSSEYAGSEFRICATATSVQANAVGIACYDVAIQDEAQQNP